MFFVPENISDLISENGNNQRYNQQKINFSIEKIQEEELLSLIKIIHNYKKGLDQEILIKESECQNLKT